VITGTVTTDWEAAVSLEVLDQKSQTQPVDTVIDTGFNGYLTLPPEWVARLGLLYHSQIVVTLADGSDIRLRQYEATVIWDGQPRDVMVLEADGGALIGMALLYRSRLTLEVLDGGPVTIELLP
jgi:clan AA aspartic protease